MADDSIRVPKGLTTEGLIPRRYLARVIDSMLISALAITVLAFLGALGPQASTDPLSILQHLLLVAIVWIGYGTLLEASPWQATLGKRVVGLRV